MLDEQAASALDSIDLLAERVRRIGGTTIRSIGHVSRLQSIEDDNDELVPANQMLQRLMDDNRQMAEKQRGVRSQPDRPRSRGRTVADHRA